MCSSSSNLCSSNCTFVWGAESAPQASWLGFGEAGEGENGREKKVGGKSKKKRGGQGKGTNGMRRGRKGNRGGKGKEGILCSCDFSLRETLSSVVKCQSD